MEDNMSGIIAYGAYIPRLRLDRMSIFQGIGWLAPAVITVAQGERSFCNWDEDAITMAVAAAKDCLIGMDKRKVEALYLASTTLPFKDRLNAGVVSTALNLKQNILALDMTSSLKAGTTSIVAALESIKSEEKDQILVTATDMRETKAASHYEMWFGDGAAALLLGNDNVIAKYVGSHSITMDFVSHYRTSGRQYDYTWEERWVRDEGYGKIIPQAIEGLLSKLGLTIDDIQKLVYPCLFTRTHGQIARSLGAGPEIVLDNMHEVCGETGAAHPLVMLVRALEDAEPGDRIIVAGFGQGCDAICFEVTENIHNLPPREAVRGSLENRKQVNNYFKFLKFRNLITTEEGIRAEAPSQTALSTLWRKREMVLGLVGGKCTKCGTPQFPKMDICVNPECAATHSQEDYEFADIPAAIMSYTGDMLAVSEDPPAIYGMVQFEGGGRLMADFSDCELGDLKVGLPVKMVFRRHAVDPERGFIGYFWKAVPLVTADEVEEREEVAEIRFDDQVAIVTGGGGGLGRAYALTLAKHGAKVVVNDLGGARDGSGKGSSRPADEVVQEILEAGGEAIANYDTVATQEGGERIVQAALDQYGKVDILINNAGILRDKSFAKMTTEMWEDVLTVHLQGTYNVTQPAFRAMREQGYGRIVMTTSAAGLYGNFGQTNYGAAKMGVVGLMNTLKLEGEKYNIKVNTVAPLAITRLTEDVMPDEFREQLKPELVTPLVLYLCSDGCKDSGLILNAGGGFFNRAAFFTGRGVLIGDGKEVPTLEQIHQHWQEIDSLENAREYPDANTALIAMMTPAAVEERETPEGGGESDVKAIFDRMPEHFQKEAAAGLDVVFQFSISGSGGGDWHVTVKGGECEVGSGVHSKPTTTIKMTDDDFMQYVSGKLPAMQAYTAGRLKVEGDLMKSQLIEKLFKF
jgi:3-hydroxy-3-methylglutaryl CoA synthase/NAD(P)-dependent dehydrogenase (short-subunit alcohol dehydrogenase family)/putative sterol carrier protein